MRHTISLCILSIMLCGFGFSGGGFHCTGSSGPGFGLGDPYTTSGEEVQTDCSEICGFRTPAAALSPDSVVIGGICEGGCLCVDVGVPPCDLAHLVAPRLSSGQLGLYGGRYPEDYGKACRLPDEDPLEHVSHAYRWSSVVCSSEGCECDGLVPYNKAQLVPAMSEWGRLGLVGILMTVCWIALAKREGG